jgi:hypothetical protein
MAGQTETFQLIDKSSSIEPIQRVNLNLWWQRECIKIPRFLLGSLAAVPHFLQPRRPQRIDAIGTMQLWPAVGRKFHQKPPNPGPLSVVISNQYATRFGRH